MYIAFVEIELEGDERDALAGYVANHARKLFAMDEQFAWTGCSIFCLLIGMAIGRNAAIGQIEFALFDCGERADHGDLPGTEGFHFIAGERKKAWLLKMESQVVSSDIES